MKTLIVLSALLTTALAACPNPSDICQRTEDDGSCTTGYMACYYNLYCDMCDPPCIGCQIGKFCRVSRREGVRTEKWGQRVASALVNELGWMSEAEVSR